MTNIPALLIGRRRVVFARLVANGLTQACVAVVASWCVRALVDRLYQSGPARALLWSAPHVVWSVAGLMLAAVCLGGLRMWERVDAERLGQSYASAVRLVLYDCLSTAAPRALQKRSRGGVSLRFVGDMTSLRRWVSLGLARVVVAGVAISAALLGLAVTSWPLALAVGAAVLGAAATVLSFGGRMRAASRLSRSRLGSLAANVNEKVTSIAVVQVFGQVARERKRIVRQAGRVRGSMVARARVAGQILGLTEFSVAMTSATALIVGLAAVHAGHASIGSVVGALTIIHALVPRLSDLGGVQEAWHGARVARERLQKFLDTPSLSPRVFDAPKLTFGSGRLVFSQVSVEGSLHAVSAIVEPGTVVALVGPNGAGKSTLLALAARLVEPDEGSVSLDGQDLAAHSLNSLRRAIGMAGPDLPLLRGSVQRNLCYRWRAAPADEIARVRARCGGDEVLVQLPEGEATRVSEGGLSLSVGQRQRIALARALLGNPPLLLLDEVDANLDPRSNAIIDRILAQHRGTVLLATHHFEHVMAADAVWYLEAGRLLEAGPPAVLMASGGATAQLFGAPKKMNLLNGSA